MEGDYDSGSCEEEEEEDPLAYIKPVFVPKHLRQSSVEKAVEEEQHIKWEEKKVYLQQVKKDQAKSLVADVVRMRENGDNDNDDATSDAGIPDDSDDVTQYEEWKIREIMRIKRDTEERETIIREQEEVKRRRNMTDAEREAEDRQLGLLNEDNRDDKPKWKFLQKYYHKGAFYMDVDSVKATTDVRKKEYSEPTLEDHVDKERLPKILQVKNFGKRSRTKYTHLLDQDTTVQNNKRVDLRPDQRAMSSYLGKMGGAKKI